MAQVMGYGLNLTHRRRCHFCHRPVKFGYLVKDSDVQGFFCGRMCYELAAKHKRAEMEKRNANSINKS
jgi:hypothetical protein